MSYIGTQQGTASPVLLDSITVVNNQAAYTMQKSGVNYTPASTLVMQVSLNGIIQAPNSSYTINGSTITFDSALVTGDVIDYILVREPTTGTIAPVDGSVTNSKIVSMAASKLTGALPAIDGCALTGIALTASSTIPAEGGTATTNIVQGLAKHWLNMNGTGTIATRDSFNNSSITDTNTGTYTLAFTNNMSNNDYAVATMARMHRGVSNSGGANGLSTSDGDSDGILTSGEVLSYINVGTQSDADVPLAGSITFGDLA